MGQQLEVWWRPPPLQVPKDRYLIPSTASATPESAESVGTHACADATRACAYQQQQAAGAQGMQDPALRQSHAWMHGTGRKIRPQRVLCCAPPTQCRWTPSLRWPHRRRRLRCTPSLCRPYRRRCLRCRPSFRWSHRRHATLCRPHWCQQSVGRPVAGVCSGDGCLRTSE